MWSVLRSLRVDLRCKARWCYGSDRWPTMVKVCFTDGSAAMILYRLMQGCRKMGQTPIEMVFKKLTAICCNCIIGRGAEFGPGFVLIHSSGVVINGAVRGGCGIHLEHQVTLGAENRHSPVLGDDVFIGAGAKVIGGVMIGDGARIGANAVVIDDVPAHATAVGVPARLVVRAAERDKVCAVAA
jgi:serine O-acetyltransferase